MKLSTLLVALAVPFCLNTSPLSAQDTPAPDAAYGQQRLAVNLSTFLDQYYKANGGREHLLSVRSLYVNTTLNLGDGVSGNLVYVQAQPNRIRSTFYGPRGVIP